MSQNHNNMFFFSFCNFPCYFTSLWQFQLQGKGWNKLTDLDHGASKDASSIKEAHHGCVDNKLHGKRTGQRREVNYYICPIHTEMEKTTADLIISLYELIFSL